MSSSCLPSKRPGFSGLVIALYGGRASGSMRAYGSFAIAESEPVESSAAPPRPPRPAQISIERAGSAPKQITHTDYSHRDVIVSPDGKWIAFTADAALRSDSAVTAERDSIAKLPPDRKRDELPRNASEIFILPVGACEAGEKDNKPE